MELCRIETESLIFFRSLLLPETAELLERGEPVLALGLTEGDTACGAAAGYPKDGVFQLESFYVAPEYRRRGGGHLLLETLLRACSGYCWGMAAEFTATKPEHDLLLSFLEARGFQENRSGGVIYGTTVGQLEHSPFLGRITSEHSGAVPFSELPPGCLETASREAEVRGENYLRGGLTSPQVDPDFSMGITEGGSLRSFVVMTRPAADHLDLSWAFSSRRKDLPILLCSLFRSLREREKPETRLTILAVTKVAEALIERILPDAERLSHSLMLELDPQRIYLKTVVGEEKTEDGEGGQV